MYGASVSVLSHASVTPNFKYVQLLHACNWLRQVPTACKMTELFMFLYLPTQRGCAIHVVCMLKNGCIHWLCHVFVTSQHRMSKFSCAINHPKFFQNYHHSFLFFFLLPPDKHTLIGRKRKIVRPRMVVVFYFATTFILCTDCVVSESNWVHIRPIYMHIIILPKYWQLTLHCIALRNIQHIGWGDKWLDCVLHWISPAS